MIRVLNFFCVALMGLSILALYHVSEQTRVAQMELTKVNREIARNAQHDRRAADRMGSMSPVPRASSNWPQTPAGHERQRLRRSFPPSICCRAAADRAAEQYAAAQRQRAGAAIRRDASCASGMSPQAISDRSGCEAHADVTGSSSGASSSERSFCAAAFALVGIRLVDVTLLQRRWP